MRGVGGGMYLGDWTPALARLFGDKEAVFDATTGASVSYTGLAARIDAAARALFGLGVQRGDRVAALAKNRIEHLDLLFACARLGAIFVPLNWRLKEPELGFLLDDAEPKALFFERSFDYLAGRLCATREVLPVCFDVPDPRRARDPERDEEGAQAVADAKAWPFVLEEHGKGEVPEQARLSLEDPWIILYTSGTTGHPKGALLPYRQVCFNALNTIVALDLAQGDSTITYTPLFHTGALHVLTTPLLAKGGTVILQDGFDAEAILDLVEQGKVSVLFGVPTTFEMIAASPRFAKTDFSRVRIALCGGAPCPVSLIERYTARGLVFKQGYGLTEVGPNCLNLTERDVVRKAGSAGQPNLTIAVRVLDADDRPLRGAGRGELCLGGPAVCLGYWRRPDANAKAFTEDGFFRTGDVVEVDDDGFYYIVDRAKDMFISGGENVYPAEVERTLCDHPDVRAAAVIGIPDPRWGEVGRAYLEARSARLDVEKLRAWLKERLANYKVPKEIVVVDALPRNASGKVQKHLLDKSVPQEAV